ncbi:DUF262 domain-containing protein [Psychroserpens luteus]|uniref:DUF262 domain-containing protein n=1 Tax=Psychroserpens luteus TaxID=1434066 RepID=A0ABW5ZPG9_9FLAO|nr:DUF262 domain-containing protein [Psychroserpens luteus]
MQEDKYKGEILSFYELLNKHRIEIPIIQRDYAQGRKDKQEIRLKFLNALLTSIEEENPIKLDFIYGSNVKETFQPLDGQQRLTTLFLLHWYGANREKLLTTEKISVLGKFSYETRITSRDFCSSLVSNDIEIFKETSLSSEIIDSSWFFLSWKKDPTIDAMLRTLDDIHNLFFNIPDLWSKLISNKNLISFYHVELENIGLTDDLYIKMNARGKLLSSFENFKAGFQKHINDNNWEKGKSLKSTFVFKIDTIWTDFFWNNFKKDNRIDDALIRFISTISMIRQSIERKGKTDERLSIIRGLQDNPNFVRPLLFDEIDFQYLIKYFELYNEKFQVISDLNLNFPFWQHKPKTNFLKEVVFEDENASYTQKLLFFAQAEYFLVNEIIDPDKYSDWIRVIRNLVSRGDIERNGNRPTIARSPAAFDGLINLISELSLGCKDIYLHLATVDSIKSTFAKEQVEEERVKAKLIIDKESRKNTIFQIEDNDLLRGRLEFPFHCINFNGNIEEFNDNLFQDIQSIFSKYFKEESIISNDLRRAFLTIEVDGKYEYYNYWWSLWYVVYSVKRCLIDSFRELEYYMYSEYNNYFKKLILELRQTDLKQIIANFEPPENFPNWKTRLIKESELLDKKSKSNYIAILEDNSSCYLLKSVRPRDEEGSVQIL